MKLRGKKGIITILAIISSVSIIGCSRLGSKFSSNEAIEIVGGKGEKIVSDNEVIILKSNLDYWDRSAYKSENIQENPMKESKTIVSKYTPYLYNVKTKKEKEIDKVAFYNNYILSDDGKYLVYEEWRDAQGGKQAIKVYNFKTKEISELNIIGENTENAVVNLKNTVWIDNKSFMIGLDNEELLYKVNLEESSIEPITIDGIDIKHPRILGVSSNKVYYYSHKGNNSVDTNDEKIEEFIISTFDLNTKEVKEVLKENFAVTEPKVLFYNDGFITVDASSGPVLEEKNFSNIRRYNFEGEKVSEIKVGSLFDYRVGVSVNNKGNKFVYGDYNEVEGKYVVHVADMDSGEEKNILMADKVMPIKYDENKDRYIITCKDKKEVNSTTYVINNLEKQQLINYVSKEDNVDEQIEKAKEVIANKKGTSKEEYALYDTKIIKGQVYYGFRSSEGEGTVNRIYVNKDTNEILEDGQELYVNDEGISLLISDTSIY